MYRFLSTANFDELKKMVSEGQIYVQQIPCGVCMFTYFRSNAYCICFDTIIPFDPSLASFKTLAQQVSAILLCQLGLPGYALQCKVTWSTYITYGLYENKCVSKPSHLNFRFYTYRNYFMLCTLPYWQLSVTCLQLSFTVL